MKKISNFMKKFFSPKIFLITHSHRFHPDDVFACATLMILAEKKNKRYKIIRTRDEKILEKFKEKAREKKDRFFVFDVGGVYEKENNLFDHHQKTFSKKREEGFCYSSFGLVWEKFGKELCEDEEISQKIDKKMVKAIDADDVGFDMKNTDFDFHIWDIADVVESFVWGAKNKKDFDKNFLKVIKLARHSIESLIKKEQKTKKDFKKFLEIYETAKEKRVIWIDQQEYISVPRFLPDFADVFFIVSKRSDGKYSIKTLQKKENSFENKKDLPKKWGGLKYEELEKVSGVEGLEFCHSGLFLAVARDKISAEKAVEKILEEF